MRWTLHASQCLLILTFYLLGGDSPLLQAEFQAGAASVDITPSRLPVIVSGGFLERQDDRVIDPLHVRCLVLADERETIAIVVVDSCMIPRDVCDRIKRLATQQTLIREDRMLVAATHTHSAPSLMDFCLGSRADHDYVEFMVPRVARCIALAAKRLRPAEAGWTSVAAPAHTFCRRWVRRPDRVGDDPFGEATVRAMMHPGYQNPDYLGPAGPVDDGLSLLSLRTLDGHPICVLSNYSMHYVGGVAGISADYWGHYSQFMKQLIPKANGLGKTSDHFVAMMSQGTSGDLHWMDYSRPRQATTVEQYARELVDISLAAYQRVNHQRNVQLAMCEAQLTLGRRRPDAARLQWAQELNAQRGDRVPQSRPEVYAQQAVWIHEHPREELVLQAIRIGGLMITAMPNEVYGITGLKLKAQSPLETTFNMELANGAAGYIPPPEQHRLGGYTTWPARTAGLEVSAEPKIVERLLQLMEQVAGKPRRVLTNDLYPAAIRAHHREALGGK